MEWSGKVLSAIPIKPFVVKSTEKLKKKLH